MGVDIRSGITNIQIPQQMNLPQGPVLSPAAPAVVVPVRPPWAPVPARDKDREKKSDGSKSGPSESSAHKPMSFLAVRTERKAWSPPFTPISQPKEVGEKNGEAGTTARASSTRSAPPVQPFPYMPGKPGWSAPFKPIVTPQVLTVPPRSATPERVASSAMGKPGNSKQKQSNSWEPTPRHDTAEGSGYENVEPWEMPPIESWGEAA